jgi:murein DD-endopeptidase MepM/ murein hydrolase activator NlpD
MDFEIRRWITADQEESMKSTLKGASRFLGKILPWGYLVLLLLTSCRNGKDAVTNAKTDTGIDVPASETTFVLHNLGLNFDSWNPSTNRAGDFLFKAGEEKVFIEFGARVETEGGEKKVFPAFEYRIVKNASVTAVAAGRIVQIEYNGGPHDCRILARSNVDPRWDVLYNHVGNPRVAMGDTVTAGTVLGNPGPWDADLGRVQIMVIDTGTRFSHCPLCFFDSVSAEAARTKVQRLMADWESFKNDATIYDERDQDSPGCRVLELDGTEVPESYPAFTIQGLGVNFDRWDPATNRAGDFVFTAGQQKVFLEFGARVGAGGGGTKELPTFEYRISKNALVKAVAEGRIVRFEYQDDTQDYEIIARSRVNPNWDVGYDHVKNPRVAMGDTVSAGTVLGNPGTWEAGLGRFEIMINNNATRLSYCPFCVFDPDSAEAVKARVLRHMTDWEAFKHDPTIYDEKNQVLPGCRYRDMVTY